MLSVQQTQPVPLLDYPSTTHGAQSFQNHVGFLDVERVASIIRSTLVIDDYKNHLAILGPFHKVHGLVEDGGVAVNSTNNVPVISPAQYLSLARAQYRFDAWVEKVLRRAGRAPNIPLEPHELPPIDVCMFLHAYMLRPWNFYEDCARVYPELEHLGGFPIALLNSQVNYRTMEIDPTEEQKNHWLVCTGLPFDIPLQTHMHEAIKVNCPRCAQQTTVQWVTESGTGFGQEKFSALCGSCHDTFDRGAMCVRRFLEDLARPRAVLANALLNSSGQIDQLGAQKLAQTIRRALGEPSPSDGGRFEWKISKLFDILMAKMNNAKQLPLLYRIKEAYLHTSQTSLDIGAAVLRQARFINEMHHLKWCGASAILVPDEKLADAVVRYCRFLTLDGDGIVPDLDIDLIFHTHQLQGHLYREDSIQITGSFLNHDDSYERDEIETNFEMTQKIWEESFAISYSESSHGGRVKNFDGEYIPVNGGKTPPKTGCTLGCGVKKIYREAYVDDEPTDGSKTPPKVGCTLSCSTRNGYPESYLNGPDNTKPPKPPVKPVCTLSCSSRKKIYPEAYLNI